MRWNKTKKTVIGVAVTLAAAALIVVFCSPAMARVQGVCSNCHTMHNSQNGSSIAREGTNVGWTGSPNWELAGGSSAADAGPSLVIANCVGCHSCNTSDVIIEFGGSRIPIVYNTGGLDDDAVTLAGGNFCWVNTKGDAYGHNVYGISEEDSSLTMAPGNQQGCSNAGCHYSLAKPGSESSSLFDNKGGCEGCHYYVSHHDTRTPQAYRFLEGHGSGPVNERYVTGLEDDDWEHTGDSSDHNEYKGDPDDWGTSGTSNLQESHSMSSYCKGCHTDFHLQNDGSSWIRHPSDAVIPNSGEYQYAFGSAGDGAAGVYDPLVPVARPSLTAVSSEVNLGTDMVMCLSCHRPHGSPYDDLLRWDYSEMNAGGGDNVTGCFACHTTKDTGG